jgi:hypothetical protein
MYSNPATTVSPTHCPIGTFRELGPLGPFWGCYTHPGRRAGPRPEEHQRDPCATGASSSMIRPSGKVRLRTGIACCKVCLRYFILMLQVFHVDVAKVDQNVSYVAMVVHVCCKLLFPMFELFFQTYVASVFI